jgi:hypothetical protein
VLNRLEGITPGITGLQRRSDGSLVLDEPELENLMRQLGGSSHDLDEEKTEDLSI